MFERDCRRLRDVLPVLAALALAYPGAANAATVGLYTDPTGATCSFSGNNTGPVTAYAVVRPDAGGLIGVRFAAPLPACLGATFLYDAAAPGASITGSSPDGVAISFPQCVPGSDAVYVLQITYYRAGSTAPCCAFPVVADPLVGSIEVLDCSFQSVAGQSVVSHFNADGSCPCAAGTPPEPPANPDPAHGATGISVATGLAWTEAAPDVSSYDVYIGTNPSPGFAANVASPSYQPALPLQELTQYYWKVVAHDVDGLTTSGPTWTFTTRLSNSPPNAPAPVYPPDFSVLVPLSISLQWVCQDIDNDALTYDLYFGLDADPPQIATGLVTPSFALAPLSYGTLYHWKVVAHDSDGNTTTGAVWGFTTRPANLPPAAPTSPNPNNVWGLPYNGVILTWQGSDPDNDPLTYDVYFKQTDSYDMPLVASNLTTASYGPLFLQRSSNFFWKVVARDSHGLTTAGSLWQFSTATGSAPTVSLVSPADNATNVPLSPMLTWKGSDPDGDVIHYDVWFSSGGAFSQVATDITTTFFTPPGPLPPGATCAWILAYFDTYGVNGFSTAIYHFTTVSSPTAAGELPLELSLGRPHPNPFNPQAIIPYSVPKGAPRHIRITIFDAAGRRVRTLVDETLGAGEREVVWRGDNDAGATVSSGLYYCVLQSGIERRTQKLVLLK